MSIDKKQQKANEDGGEPTQAVSKEQAVLQMQQENEGSDEEYLSENEEVIDANDASASSAGALDLNLDNGEQKIWLVRLPRFLAERWRAKDNFHGQKIGKIKIKQPITDAINKNVIRLELDDNEETRDIPHNYDLNLTKREVENQYVFTEQNLENFKKPKPEEENGDSKNAIDEKQANGVKPELKPIDKREAAFLRRRRRFNRYKNQDGTDKVIPFVKTIPKKTALKGTIVHECQLNPQMSDPNYSKIIARRANLVKEEPRPTVTLLNEIPGVTLSNTGLTLRTDTSKFLKSTTSTKNKGEGRAIRMPQKDLFDLLFKLFDEYDYWSLKGLKERTKQPEVYLKETLEQIAQLIKKGPYALKYALKREFKELKDQERAERLGELSKENDEDEEEDNDEDVEMEDVV